MINANQISEWLQQPDKVNEQGSAELEKFLDQFPYLVPARLLLAHFHKDTDHQLQQLHVNRVMVNRVLMPNTEPAKVEEWITPVSSSDYFRSEGIEVKEDVAELPEEPKSAEEALDADQSLMVMMSFADWLNHFKKKSEVEKEEEEGKRSLKTLWQKEKLAAALEEEDDEIPEKVFEMAVNSIANEEDLISESLAVILVKQGKLDKAREMYRKLSLQHPQKSAYFAVQIENLQRNREI